MTPKLTKAMINKFLGKQTTSGELNFNYMRKARRLKKIAKRMFYNKANQTELEIFEKYKRDLGVKFVLYNKYNKEYVLL